MGDEWLQNLVAKKTNLINEALIFLLVGFYLKMNSSSCQDEHSPLLAHGGKTTL